MAKTKTNISATIDTDVLNDAKAIASADTRTLSNYVEAALKSANKSKVKGRRK